MNKLLQQATNTESQKLARGLHSMAIDEANQNWQSKLEYVSKRRSERLLRDITIPTSELKPSTRDILLGGRA